MGNILKESGEQNVRCLGLYKKLKELDSTHELLNFGDVHENDTHFYINDGSRDQFAKMFCEGVIPRGVNGSAAAFRNYANALEKASETDQARA